MNSYRASAFLFCTSSMIQTIMNAHGVIMSGRKEITEQQSKRRTSEMECSACCSVKSPSASAHPSVVPSAKTTPAIFVDFYNKILN